MKYSYLDWNKKKGSIPIFWKKQHYVDSEWYRHPDKLNSFSTNSINYKIYGDNIGVCIPKKLDIIFEKALQFFDIDEPVYNICMHEPGMILPWHHDNYPVYIKNKKIKNIENIVRIIVFLHDSEPGHQLWIKDEFCSGPSGSWFSWQGKVRHMAANLGEVNRYVLQITGIVE